MVRLPPHPLRFTPLESSFLVPIDAFMGDVVPMPDDVHRGFQQIAPATYLRFRLALTGRQ